ncbi:origin recognition complex subunit 2 [Adelges cooleyi]|uniref:origin recognition complex subunit 2 n=1 Tax=Adelges cooleyi TaxID=133065 RepID=UPI00217F3C16|nr:origin recognition complex subunit 2 [Adelges cooleyi]
MMGTIGDDNAIEVEFISDKAVTHLIKDSSILGSSKRKVSFASSRSNKVTDSKTKSEIQHNSRKSLRTKRVDYTTPDSNNSDEANSDIELASTSKPRALFNDGDVPGACMFSFNSSKKKKTSTSQIDLKKTPKSARKINEKTEKRTSSIQPKALFDDDDDDEDSDETKSDKTKNNKTSKVKFEKPNSSSFGFETPKKSKNSHTPKKSNNTPSIEQKSNSDNLLTKTPRIIRKKIAKEIALQKLEQLSELNDSDYSVSEKSDESDSDSSVHSETKKIQPEINTNLRRSTRKKEVPFMYKAEEYFLSKSVKSMKKSKTSDNTLKLLKNPTLNKCQIEQLSVNSNIIHEKKLHYLYKGITEKFPYWKCLLKEGFNLLLYGFGSKRQFIDDFRTSMLENEFILVINGFFPGLTIKEILESIIIDILELDNCPGSAELAVQQIEEVQKSRNSESIYILVHNIDGISLQSYKVQQVLSRICSIKNIHLIASIDRVNAALMWDNTKLGDYNFIWMDCTSFNSYTVETSFMESLMVKNTGSTHTLSALSNVYKSLTSNSKRILLLLIKDRIENKSDKRYGGVPFSILYGWCRQRFLVSTDLALRSQLTEFVDHELVKWKRDSDVLQVSLDVDVLIQFYKQNEEDDE